ncbi:hypothetical protein LDO31_14660 [Luteimonas sp. XNQY3]|nr:hypothetical protein [Luteimonas sp. XNQY3]MCD9007458.1 hypothetical protein [Luteimonas sp. XNQY3]
MNRWPVTVLPLVLLAVTPTFAQERASAGGVVSGPVRPAGVPEGPGGVATNLNEPDTGPLTAALQERFGDRIAGIYIEREPDFHVVVRLTGKEGEGSLPYQLGDDKVRVEVQTDASHSVDQLRAAFKRRDIITRFLPTGYGGYIDERTGDLVLTVEVGDEAATGKQAALAEALGVPVRIVAEERAVVFPAPQQMDER